MKIKQLVLDFDGVIVDSAQECWLRCVDASNADDSLLNIMKNDKNKNQSFLKFRYLVGPPHEYYYLVKALENVNTGTEEEIVDKFNTFVTTNNEENAYRFKKYFFNSRKLHKKKDFSDWVSCNKVYKQVIEMAKKFMAHDKLFIATMKDEQSVADILSYNKIKCPMSHILGNSHGTNKYEHILKIIEMSKGVKNNEICFIDDNYKHLIETATIGVTMRLATWGYVSEETLITAQNCGVKLINLSDCENVNIYE